MKQKKWYATKNYSEIVYRTEWEMWDNKDI